MFRFIIIILALLWPNSVQQEVKVNTKAPNEIIVAVASSLTLPMEEIAQHFEEQYQTNVNLTFASSGVLTAQIIHGAPYDVFISANLAYPRKLDRLKKTNASTNIFALGSLVLWSKTNFTEKSLKDFLASDQIQRLAIANPDLAPFGGAAVKWLKRKNFYQQVQSKLVYGENIGSVNQFIASGTIDMALTSVSALNALQLHKKGYWETLSASEISGIPHGAVVIKQNHLEPIAQTFLHYLSSDDAQKVFYSYGYTKPKE